MASVHDFSAERLTGGTVSLADYRGKVLLIVNTASQCGLTPQYAELEAIYRHLNNRGFEILAFPCNQFLSQEPGDAKAIEEFCQRNFGTTFPMFAKTDVNGANAHPLYRHLKSEAPGLAGTESIKWNFTKFLVDKYGKVVRRYAPQTTPKSIADDITQLLDQQ